MRIVELLFYNRLSFRRQQKLRNCKIVSVYEFIYSYTRNIILDSHKPGQNIYALYVRFFKRKWMQLPRYGRQWSSQRIYVYIHINTEVYTNLHILYVQS